MKPGARIVLLAISTALLSASTEGCTAAGHTVRNDSPPGVAVRLPITESPSVHMKTEEAQRPLPPGPLSVGDEYRGRWLTLIEININPPPPEEPTGSSSIIAP